MPTRLTWMLASLLVWMSCPGQVNAHLVNSGFGPVYDGIAHLFLTPEDVLVVLALALLAGLGGKPCARVLLFVLPSAWLAGALGGRMISLSAGIPAVSAVLLIGLGTLVAADCRLPPAFVAGAALLCGLLNGCFNGAALAQDGMSALAVVGIVCGVFVIVAIVAGQTAALRSAWTRIAVRVAGSWIAAIGLLLFGWAMRQILSASFAS